MKKSLIFLLILLSASYAEREPNDTCLESEPMILLDGADSKISDQMVGSIVSTKYDTVNNKPDYDKDYYHFTPKVSGEVEVSFVGSGNMYFWIGTKGCDKGWNISREFSRSVTKIFHVEANQRVQLRPMCRWQRDYTINVTFTPDKQQPDVSGNTLEDFVKRMYTTALKREPEEGGFNYWTGVLRNGDTTAVDMAKFFFDSPEFKSFNLSNEEFLNRVYATIMNRKPDQEGYEYWLNKLNSGEVTRSEVVAMFVDAPEFKKLAEQYGIKANNLPPH
ncbi:MAG: DUF4214 domain-containing protein [Epsilonproteobacteria bacterium]|nr:DUF4214 domain-containing protein [Campylobacterota bacterium]